MKRLLAGVCCAWWLCVVTAYAEESPFATAVTTLFNQGWKPSPNPKVHDELAEVYAQIKQASGDDARGPYAYALVLTRQRKYDDALKLLDETLAKNKMDIAARRMKIWLLILTKRYPVALVEMDTLSKLLPPANAQGAAEEPFHDAATFLGRMFAYLEGPAAGGVNQNLVLQHKSALFGRLTSSRQDAFEGGGKTITSAWTEKSRDKERTQADAKEAEDKLKEQTKRDLEIERARVAQQLSSLDTKADKVRNDSGKEIADLDAQLSPLNAEFNRANARRNAIATDVLRLQTDIASYLDAASRTQDRNEEFLLRAEAGRLDVLLGRAAADLRAAEIQLADVANRRGQVEARRQTAVANRQQQLDGLDRQAQTLRQTEKRIGFDEQKLRTPSSGITSKVVGQTATMNALTTYDDYPLDAERQRILDSLK